MALFSNFSPVLTLTLLLWGTFSLFPDRSNAVDPVRSRELKSVILSGLDRYSPHAGPIGGGLFRGSFDWHSSVHAHWALLSIARETDDEALERLLMERLVPSALTEERRYLNRNPKFELPYGQAWLILLLEELGRRPKQRTPEWSALRQETLIRLESFLRQQPFPERNGRLIASHHSWLFAYFLVQLSQIVNENPLPSTTAWLNDLAQTKIDPARAKIARYRPSDYDFVDLPGILHLIDQLRDRSTEVRTPPQEWPPLRSPIERHNAHTAGRAVMQLWPYAPAHSTNANYRDRQSEIFAQSEQWRDDFATVSHWVPQFMWMMYWLESRPHQKPN